MAKLFVKPRNEAQALTRMETLPWAYHSEAEGLDLIARWKRGERNAVVAELKAEVECHRMALNWSKGEYINNVLKILAPLAR